jgi:hypothetical protein
MERPSRKRSLDKPFSTLTWLLRKELDDIWAVGRELVAEESIGQENIRYDDRKVEDFSKNVGKGVDVVVVHMRNEIFCGP